MLVTWIINTAFILQDAHNPEAEASYINKHREDIGRLQAEMDGLVSSRIQQLDQEHSILEYVRDKASLCCDQAKVMY